MYELHSEMGIVGTCVKSEMNLKVAVAFVF
jgi:hypothetical protein